MRICFIAHGRFTHIDGYLQYFGQRGHEVYFVALAPGPNCRFRTYNAGTGRFGKLGYFPAMLRARSFVRALAPDIVHAHYATSAGLAAYVCGIHPYIVTAHGTDVTCGVESVAWRPILQRIFAGAALVNPVSENLHELILSMGVCSAKIKTVGVGIDLERFAFSPQMRPLHGAVDLICTRRLEAVYDHHTILQAAGILAQEGIDFRLTLLGSGPLRPRLVKLARKLGILDRVRFLGWIDNRRLPGLLASHSIYLSASHRDGASLSLLEAMACGAYPIVSDISANRLWISHGRNGLLHEVGSSISLAHCVKSALQEPELMPSALRMNRSLILERGDRRKNMQSLEGMYYSLRRAHTGNGKNIL